MKLSDYNVADSNKQNTVAYAPITFEEILINYLIPASISPGTGCKAYNYCSHPTCFKNFLSLMCVNKNWKMLWHNKVVRGCSVTVVCREKATQNYLYLPLKTTSRYESPARRKELEHFKSSCLENTKTGCKKEANVTNTNKCVALQQSIAGGRSVSINPRSLDTIVTNALPERKNLFHCISKCIAVLTASACKT